MNEREIAEFVGFCVERMQHLLRLASVTDSATMARYILALQRATLSRFDALESALGADEAAEVGDLPN